MISAAVLARKVFADIHEKAAEQRGADVEHLKAEAARLREEARLLEESGQ